MTEQDKQRIEKDAKEYCTGSPQYIFEWRGYIAGATAENERIKKLIYEIQPRDGKHFPEGWSREEIITILFE